MVNIPAKVKDRLIAGVKKYQPIVAKAKDKDINESDTVTIISDILSDVFGYDKYTEITSEYAIKKTFCDLAIKIDGSPRLLIEAKAAGLELKEQHIKQAVDYGSNSGVEWVILTNSVSWKVYTIIFSKPVMADLVYEFNFADINTKKLCDLEMLYYLAKESVIKGNKSSLDEFYLQQQLINRFTIGQILLTDPVLDAVRKTIKKISSDANVSNDEIRKIVLEEIIKRDVLDDEKAAEAKKKVAKALKPAAPKAAPTTEVKATEV
jgi:Uncharacterized conserved protein